MLYRIKRFLRKIGKIIGWLPILWKDEDWDYEYILDILRHKVDTMGVYIRDSGIALNDINTYYETRDFIQAIDNYINSNDLFENIYREYYQNLPERMTFKIENNRFVSLIDGIPDEEHELCGLKKDYYTHMIEFEQECWDTIWNIIKKNGLKWWN